MANPILLPNNIARGSSNVTSQYQQRGLVYPIEADISIGNQKAVFSCIFLSSLDKSDSRER
jgi:hypothetical protein